MNYNTKIREYYGSLYSNDFLEKEWIKLLYQLKNL